VIARNNRRTDAQCAPLPFTVAVRSVVQRTGCTVTKCVL